MVLQSTTQTKNIIHICNVVVHVEIPVKCYDRIVRSDLVEKLMNIGNEFNIEKILFIKMKLD